MMKTLRSIETSVYWSRRRFIHEDQNIYFLFTYLFIYGLFTNGGGRSSSVGVATLYGLEGPGIESRWGTRFTAPDQPGPGAHLASYTVGTGSLSRG